MFMSNLDYGKTLFNSEGIEGGGSGTCDFGHFWAKMEGLSLKLEFSGGLELLLANSKEPTMKIKFNGKLMRDLVKHIRNNVIVQRPELFSNVDGEV